MSDRDCLACMSAISPESQYLQCSECKHAYHAGKCSGVSKSNLKQMNLDELQRWSCPTCATRKSKLASSQNDTDNSGGLDDHSLADIMAKLDVILSRIDTLEKKQEEQLAKHEATNSKLEEQGGTIQGIESSLELLSSKYDDILRNIESQGSEIKELKKKTADLEEQLVAKCARLSIVEQDVDRLELYSRRNNIEIHGIGENDHEDLRAVLRSTAEKLDLSAPTDEDIEALHRIKTKSKSVAPILVRFARREVREKWIAKRYTLSKDDIFINENLTARMKKLLWMTKQTAKVKQYRYVWARNGRIFVRKQEGDSVIRIDNEEALTILV